MKTGLCEKSKSISFIMLCTCMAYAVFFGTSVFLSVGSISLWRMLIAATVVTAVPVVIKNFKAAVLNPFFITLAAFGAWLAVAALMGRANSHGTEFIVRDIKSFAYLSLFPITACILTDKSRLKVLLAFVMYASFALSILSTVFMLSYILLPPLSESMLRVFWRFEFINFTQVSDKIARVLFVSTPFQLFGCAIPFYFQAEREKFSRFYPVVTGLGLFSILITYTRSLYLATFVTAVSVVVLTLAAVDGKKRKNVWKHIASSAAVVAAIVLVFSLCARVNYIGYAFQRVFVTHAPGESADPGGIPGDETPGNNSNIQHEPSSNHEIPEFNDPDSYLDATKVSDAIREELKINLVKEIKKAPFTGNGLGLTINGRESLPELFMYDLAAKAGLVGLLLFFAPLFIAFVAVAKSLKRRKHCLELYIWTGCVLGLFAYACFQPYMNNAPCMTVYSCLMSIALLQNRELKEKKTEEVT